jgi:type IX secretion system PorP/SprF family membrane protein
MKKIITSVVLMISAVAGFAQQDPQFSQNMWNRLTVNPGYAGSNGTLCGTLLGRQQWGGFYSAGIQGSTPKTALITVDAPVAALHGGLGGTVISDQIGFDKTLFVKLDYAYRMPLGPGTLGLGVEAGIINKSISGSWITPSGEPAANDNSIPQNASDLAPDFAFGAYYHTQEMYVGLSTDHLTAADLKKNNFQLARHYYIMAGYNKMVGADFELRPSIFVKTDASSTQLDVNMNVFYRNMVWGGLSYRVADAIVPMVGFQQTLKNGSSFRVGYSFDLTTSAIKTNTHEIMLGYCHKIAPKAKIQKKKTVRFL